ncbi:MAG: 3-oxoadipate enol-lactonase [Neomegalonema sp.]|nr:3-oxoadipate enol-lactonase [Neomegalonema sp.]
MSFLKPRDAVLHYSHRAGVGGAPSLVFINSLGSDFRIWDAVIAQLPPEWGLLLSDKRGHGLSQMGAAPISIAGLAEDLADLMDARGLSSAVLCGVSVGGMIAQALAHARPDLCAGLILCNTAARIGSPQMWAERIGALDSGGIEPIADNVIARWFSPEFCAREAVMVAGYRTMLARTPVSGYRAVCAAIRDTDLTEQTRALRLPSLCLGGSTDGSTPPEVVEALAGLIEGARYRCFEGSGHIPSLEVPDLLAGEIRSFMSEHFGA